MNECSSAPIDFRQFDLPASLFQGLQDAGFTECTSIQALTLPVALAGRDVAGQAQTGTGKTAAFLIAALHRLLQNPDPGTGKPGSLRMLVLAPTRELAIQIHRDALLLGKHTRLRFALAYGGTGYEKQREALRSGTDVLIGTPGRIIDYFKQHVFDLRHLEVLVLDEADRMFDLGFIKDIRYLLRRCSPPQRRQSMLFSATLSWRVMELAYEHMNNPEKITVSAENVTADRIEQSVYYPSNEQKIPLLFALAEQLQPERAIIFTNTRHGAERVCNWLNANALSAEILSGTVPQKKRNRLLSQFGNGEFRFLVATDVAARGLHIPEVSHVFNFDLPQSGEDYVHRIGRTGRAGASGVAISFACEDSAIYLPEIETFLEKRIPTARLEMDKLPRTLQAPKPDSSARRYPQRTSRSKSGAHASRTEEASAQKQKRRRPRKRPPSSPTN